MNITIDYTVPHVLWLLLDGLIFVAAMSAWGIAKSEERYWKEKNRGACEQRTTGSRP